MPSRTNKFQIAQIVFCSHRLGVQRRRAESSVFEVRREASPANAPPSPPLPQRVLRQNPRRPHHRPLLEGHRRGGRRATPKPVLFLLLLLDGMGPSDALL